MMSFIPDISPSKDCPDQKGIATGEDPVIADTSNRSKDSLD